MSTPRGRARAAQARRAQPQEWSQHHSSAGLKDLNHVQPFGNPETEDCEEQNAPSYGNYFQVTAQRTNFVANRVLFPYKVCLCGVEDEVILLFHIEHSAIQKHHHCEGCQCRFQNNQTHKGPTHVNLQKMDLDSIPTKEQRGLHGLAPCGQRDLERKLLDCGYFSCTAIELLPLNDSRRS